MSPVYPFADQLPATGTTLQVAPGVHWLRMPLPFALDHINLWLVEDGPAFTAVDTGFYNDAIRAAWQQVLPNHPLWRLIVTHFHPDHLGLAAWLQDLTGSQLWMSQGDYQQAKLMVNEAPGYQTADMVGFFRRNGLDSAMLEALTRRGNSYKSGVPSIPDTYHRLRHGHVVAIGGYEWRVIAGYGHSPEHCSLYCESLGVLISGDMLLPRISTNVPVFCQTPDYDALGDFLDSIAGFSDLPEDTLVLPSHGKPFRGIQRRVAALQQHHAERCEAVLLACATTPKSAGELIPVIFERPITDPHQSMFAMGEAMAHLNYLEHQRRVRRTEENGITRFVKAS